MAALSSPLRVCRGILKELRASKGPEYRQTLAYNFVLDQFRKNQVTRGTSAMRQCATLLGVLAKEPADVLLKNRCFFSEIVKKDSFYDMAHRERPVSGLSL